MFRLQIECQHKVVAKAIFSIRPFWSIRIIMWVTVRPRPSSLNIICQHRSFISVTNPWFQYGNFWIFQIQFDEIGEQKSKIRTIPSVEYTSLQHSNAPSANRFWHEDIKCAHVTLLWTVETYSWENRFSTFLISRKSVALLWMSSDNDGTFDYQTLTAGHN